MSGQAEAEGFVINGVRYAPGDLTFREQREVRRLIRELAENPEADIDDMSLADVVPPFVFVVLKRDNPDITLDDVLDMKLSDFMADESEPEAPKKRPTRAAKAATSGLQS